jgi:hypothetical protein
LKRGRRHVMCAFLVGYRRVSNPVWALKYTKIYTMHFGLVLACSPIHIQTRLVIIAAKRHVLWYIHPTQHPSLCAPSPLLLYFCTRTHMTNLPMRTGTLDSALKSVSFQNALHACPTHRQPGSRRGQPACEPTIDQAANTALFVPLLVSSPASRADYQKGFLKLIAVLNVAPPSRTHRLVALILHRHPLFILKIPSVPSCVFSEWQEHPFPCELWLALGEPAREQDQLHRRADCYLHPYW